MTGRFRWLGQIKSMNLEEKQNIILEYKRPKVEQQSIYWKLYKICSEFGNDVTAYSMRGRIL
jgi:hypothetical protein